MKPLHASIFKKITQFKHLCIDFMQITTSLLTNNFSTLKISNGKKYDVGMSIGIDVDKNIKGKLNYT
jgi:hypothetical protein